MIANCLSIFIGVMYGVGFMFIAVGSIKFFHRLLMKYANTASSANLLRNQSLFINIISGFVDALFLLTVLFFSPLFDNWHQFLKLWIIGFIAGACFSNLLLKKLKS